MVRKCLSAFPKLDRKSLNLTRKGIRAASCPSLVLKLCLHVTSAFACAFDANYGSYYTKWRCLHLRLCLRQCVRATQRMGWEPIFDVCVCVRLHCCNGYQVESAAVAMYFALYTIKMSSASSQKLQQNVMFQ